MIPLFQAMSLRVDLGDDQGDVGVHPEGARVVDHDRAAAAAAIGLHSRETPAGVLDRTISTPSNASSEIGSMT